MLVVRGQAGFFLFSFFNRPLRVLICFRVSPADEKLGRSFDVLFPLFDQTGIVATRSVVQSEFCNDGIECCEWAIGAPRIDVGDLEKFWSFPSMPCLTTRRWPCPTTKRLQALALRLIRFSSQHQFFVQMDNFNDRFPASLLSVLH